MNYKYSFKLNALDCANCAKRIENALNKEKYIINASVNFNNLSLKLVTNNNEDILNKINKVIREVEPNVKAYEKDIKDNTIKISIIKLIIGLLFFILSIAIKNNIIKEIFTILAYIILLEKVFITAIKKLKSFIIDENLLITISCIGAYLSEHTHEGIMVIILYNIGKILEQKAINNSRKSISDLMELKADYANLKVNDNIIRKDPKEININDEIIVKKGEKIPLDGMIVDGDSFISNKSLTGESKLVKVSKNDNVLSGSINEGNILTIKVTKKYEDSTVAQILNLLDTASSRKAKTENFVSVAARIYTPIILVLAILIATLLPLLFHISYSVSIYRALVFLVVSCPCAIAISVPLSYFSGIGISSKKGILIKGSNFLEAINKTKEIIFDKTGTITNNDFKDHNLIILNKNYSEQDIINYYVSGEEYSNHPIAKSILNIYNNVKKSKITNFKEVSGSGITFTLNNKNVIIGSSKFVGYKKDMPGIFLKVNDDIVSKLDIFDGIKINAKETIKYLKDNGIKVKMFTGDNKNIAMDVASKVGIDDVYYELMPQDKFNLLDKEIKDNNGNVSFVGDGVNDAPALKMASIGIAMGGVGSESAIESSDIVIMNDNLESLITLMNISKKTNKIIKQNLIFALGTKILVLILSTFGIATMWEAVFADTGVTLLTILNTTRILKYKNNVENK